MFVVFDLDGTLCDGTHKNALLTRPEKPGDHWPEQDWAAWTAACANDAPVMPLVHVADALIRDGHKVEFWTGRGEDARQVTEGWLLRNGLGGCDLRMRPLHLPTLADALMKAEYLERYGTPDLIFEDRASVVDMWRSHGILCAQVAPGNF